MKQQAHASIEEGTCLFESGGTAETSVHERDSSLTLGLSRRLPGTGNLVE